MKTIGQSFLNKELETPVLLLTFNRLNETKEVFNTIKMAKVRKLYIASDGPRPEEHGEDKKVQEVRDFVMTSVDWDCEVKTLFRNENMGCGKAVFEALEWFFENEESGIVLEDDVVPAPTFFLFCQELLEKYRFEEKVAMISGVNHIGYRPEKYSYVFSKYKSCWGWATWRRAWRNMDFDMKWLDNPQKDNIIKNMGVSEVSESYWRNAIEYIRSGKVSAWDWQWYFSIAAQNQLCIFPSVNLTGNIGFGEDATHTVGKPKANYLLTDDIEFPLFHPEYIVPDGMHDKVFEKKKLRDNSIKRFVPKVFKNYIKSILNLKVYNK